MTDTIIDLWRLGATDHLDALVADDVVFSSPVADYEPRNARHLMALVPQVLERIETTDRWTDATTTVTAFTARVGVEPIEGMVREHRDGDGALDHVTLFLRPYPVLRTVIRRMQELLEQHPLPVGRA